MYNVGLTFSTLVQHCTNVIKMFCVLNIITFVQSQPTSSTLVQHCRNVKKMFSVYWVYIYPANTRHSPNVCTMLAQRLRRWPNFVPALRECLVLLGSTSFKTKMVGIHWISREKHVSSGQKGCDNHRCDNHVTRQPRNHRSHDRVT